MRCVGAVRTPIPDLPPRCTWHAIEDLRFIARHMENAASFTAVPGGAVWRWGNGPRGGGPRPPPGAERRGSSPRLAAALCASPWERLAIYWKRRRRRMGTGGAHASTGANFVLSLFPPLLAGGILSFVLYGAGLTQLLPGRPGCCFTNGAGVDVGRSLLRALWFL